MKKLFLTFFVALTVIALHARQTPSQASDPVQQRQIKVLSLNNSLIDYNEQSEIYNAIANSKGVDAKWDKRTQLGKSLIYHFNDPLARQLVASQPWDYIILQDMSNLPRAFPDVFVQSVKLWKLYILENCPNKDVVVILPMNWAYSTEWDTFGQETAKLRHAYETASREMPGVKVAYVGAAYETILNEKGRDYAAKLYSDNRHSTMLATYLAALIEIGMTTDIDPADIDYVPEGIDKADAEYIRDVASRSLALRRVAN